MSFVLDFLGKKTIVYAIGHYLDPRFKDQFVSNRIEFTAKIETWIKSEVNLDESSDPAIQIEAVEQGEKLKYK
ncbi:unnamed protein product [Meloidogyne enterolobii]|uniref:Uncharacterized protein n=1 Tax=Meloidogyne enterolobii TaxID=390850 RepID=A0ACB0ZXT8_MELEN